MEGGLEEIPHFQPKHGPFRWMILIVYSAPTGSYIVLLSDQHAGGRLAPNLHSSVLLHVLVPFHDVVKVTGVRLVLRARRVGSAAGFL